MGNMVTLVYVVWSYWGLYWKFLMMDEMDFSYKLWDEYESKLATPMSESEFTSKLQWIIWELRRYKYDIRAVQEEFKKGDSSTKMQMLEFLKRRDIVFLVGQIQKLYKKKYARLLVVDFLIGFPPTVFLLLELLYMFGITQIPNESLSYFESNWYIAVAFFIFIIQLVRFFHDIYEIRLSIYTIKH